jgi:hypothetical protein
MASRHTSAKRASPSAIEQLVFFRENVSVAAPNTTTSSALAARAASSPFLFGTSTG